MLKNNKTDVIIWAQCYWANENRWEIINWIALQVTMEHMHFDKIGFCSIDGECGEVAKNSGSYQMLIVCQNSIGMVSGESK